MEEVYINKEEKNVEEEEKSDNEDSLYWDNLGIYILFISYRCIKCCESKVSPR